MQKVLFKALQGTRLVDGWLSAEAAAAVGQRWPMCRGAIALLHRPDLEGGPGEDPFELGLGWVWTLPVLLGSVRDLASCSSGVRMVELRAEVHSPCCASFVEPDRAAAKLLPEHHPDSAQHKLCYRFHDMLSRPRRITVPAGVGTPAMSAGQVIESMPV